MNRSKCWWMVVACVWAVGCDESGGDPDAGVRADADVPAEDASMSDAGSDDDAGSDGGAGDGGTSAECEPGCGATEACVRGVCLATCDAELAAWDDALAPGLAPIANLCRAASRALDVIEGEDGALRVYELRETTAGMITTFELTRWTLSAAGAAGAPEMVATTTHEGHAADMIYVGGYLDVSPDESSAIFGYTTSDPGFIGGVLDVEVGDGAVDEVLAPGNYDAAWIDDATWILNGVGLGTEAGQGLYAHDTGASSSRQVVDEMGDYSGSVAVFGDVVVGGAQRAFGETWPDGTADGRVFVLDAATLDAATAALSAWEDALAHFEGPSTFEALGGMRIASAVRDDAWMLLGIDTRTLREDAGVWTLDAPEALTTGAVFSGVVAAGETHALLEHAGGLLFIALE